MLHTNPRNLKKTYRNNKNEGMRVVSNYNEYTRKHEVRLTNLKTRVVVIAKEFDYKEDAEMFFNDIIFGC